VEASNLPPTLPAGAVNPDGSVNSCANPVAAVTGAIGRQSGAGRKRASFVRRGIGQPARVQVLAIPGTINGVWELPLEFSFNTAPGGVTLFPRAPYGIPKWIDGLALPGNVAVFSQIAGFPSVGHELGKSR